MGFVCVPFTMENESFQINSKKSNFLVPNSDRERNRIQTIENV